MRDGQHGYCFVRQNRGGVLELVTYGRTSGLAIDPIEKKPIYHMSPGASVLSFGTAGCNLGCRFCQNWHISTARDMAVIGVDASPEAIVQVAIQRNCRGIAYTYNEPTIYPEFATDIAWCAREAGLVNIAVTAGYINPAPRADFFAHMDAANVDLKSMNPAFYRQLTGGRLEVVQDTLCHLVHETSVWVEVTMLVIPGHNDSDAEFGQLSDWIVEKLNPDIPLHLSAFHPSNRMLDVPRTPPATIRRARDIALAAGLRYVYSGNIADDAGSTTYCRGCGVALVRRRGYSIVATRLTSDGRCKQCGASVPGHWVLPARHL